ncbi:polysaccharide pyruvyl transferase family protein [Zobellella sp. DQSA1]|uniref:polysaccharide pyruvyl transferase family protein n=1 Tax=Zobellella sp. DQSA1 TaxID=3342386 RepID=UPI0035BF16CD
MTYRVIGPFDRYNYGDLLFSLIIKNKLDSIGADSEYYGLIHSDLSRYGAVKTLPISSFYKNTVDGDKVIIAGGESLCTSWADLYSYVNGFFDFIYGNRFSKYLDRRVGIFSYAARLLCRGRSKYPFAFSSEEISSTVSIRFNAVGGAALARWSDNKRKKFVDNISKSEVIGVRDHVTYTSIKSSFSELNVELVPDSAILMDQVFHHELEHRDVSRQYNLPPEYIFFQVGNEKYTDLDVIYAELKKLSELTGCMILLCAIGHALGHEDVKPLSYLYERAKKESRDDFYLISDTLNVFELMSVIKNSSLYIGTSLHGVITSMSFGVPHVALNKSIEKVAVYLKDWGVEGLNKQCNEDEISSHALDAISVSKKHILETVSLQKKVANDFIDRLLR